MSPIEGLDSDLTPSGQTLGTLAYMAPGQLRYGNIYQRVDLYEVGFMILDLFIGCRVYERIHHR